jgi:hypothetical protein
MQLTVTSVDCCPLELNDQVPFKVKLLRVVPGPDRPNYWLGEMVKQLRWIDENHKKWVEHVAVCSRWQGTQIVPLAQNLPINIAYIVDPSLLTDRSLEFSKCRYVAIGVAHETGGMAEPAKNGEHSGW